MDSSGPFEDSTLNSITTRTLQNRQQNAFNSRKKTHFSGPCYDQIWSFPDSIIYYLTMNPSSPKAYKKLIKTCKYFFHKNSIILIENFSYLRFWAATSGKERLRRFNCSEKLWIRYELRIMPRLKNFDPTLASSLIPRIYKCDAKYVYLTDQIITMTELAIFTPNVERIYFCRVIVKNDDENTVATVEEIIELLPKIKEFSFDISSAHPINESLKKISLFNSELQKTVSFKNINNIFMIKHFSKIERFALRGMNENFDVETFYANFKENKHTKFDLDFGNTISDNYKTRLETVIDEYLSTEIQENLALLITFPGLDEEKWNKMKEIFYKD